MKQPERKTITVHIDCDTARLYGPIEGAITYLQRMALHYPGTNISLAENWTGYEDMTIVFEYTRQEMDGELRDRLAEETRAREQNERQAAQDRKTQKERRQYEKLRRKFG